MGQNAICSCSGQQQAIDSNICSSSSTRPRQKHVQRLNLQDLLDVFDDFRPYVTVAKTALDQSLSFQECAEKIIEDSFSNGTTKSTLEIVVENLRILTILTDEHERAFRQVFSRIDSWKFDATGRTDVAPKLKDGISVQLTPFDMNVIRQVAFCQMPSELHNYTTVLGLSEGLFRGKQDMVSQPVAMITVGAPGSGKDYVAIECENCCLSYVHQSHSGPAKGQYVVFDPDYWVTNLCKNKNEHRSLANFLNLEHLFTAIGRRHHIVFNGTGKDVRNTLGRVVSRLKEAKYRIFFCIVLAKFETTLGRIEQRRRKTGRDVPTHVVRSIYEGLQKAIPLYLQNQADLAEAIFIYDNSGEDLRRSPNFVVRKGDDVQRPTDFVQRTLALPPS